jgi:hypothetical protein
VKKPKKLIAKLSLAVFLIAQFYGITFVSPDKLASANLTSVSNTLSNNRLSFRGELNGGIAVGGGVVTLDASPTNNLNTSTSSGTLVGGDTVRIGMGGTADVRTVKTINDATRFTLNSGLTTAASDQDPVISTQSAIHTVRFTPASPGIANGAFRVLLQASATKSYSGDGLPDKDGFELDGNNLPTVTCSGGGFTWNAGWNSASISATQIGGTGTWYHVFQCRYAGTGSGAAVTMTIGAAAGNKVINPSPSGYTSSHSPGAGDPYDFRVQHTLGITDGYVVNDSTLGKIYVIESVRVTATVAPTLTFMITGVAGSTSVCGQTTDVATDQNAVPLGSITSSAFRNAAQILSVSTNAVGGYAVTASESAALTMLDTPANTIPDTTCGGACTASTIGLWTNTANKGFGYALDNKKGSPVAAGNLYNNGGAYMARPFGRTAESIMDNTAVVDLDQAYVCYRAIVSGTQAAGDYENYVTYIATGRF